MNASGSSNAADDFRLVNIYGAEVLVGRTLEGRYRIDEQIDRGNVATVFRAVDLQAQQPVALKVVIPKAAARRVSMNATELVERFSREADMIRRLGHPNTVRVFDFGRNEHFLFMVMELLEGESLKHLVARENALHPARSLRIARQIAGSAGEAHTHGLVHRDLKPANIFMTFDDAGAETVKVLDFGVAKWVAESADQKLTAMGRAVGSPEYMSPEQARGMELDGRSDIYSIGVLLFEMLTGRTPFRGESAVNIMRMHVTDYPPELHELDPRFEPFPELNDLVMCCLEKFADDRFRDAAEFLTAIDVVEAAISKRGGWTANLPAV